MSSGATDLSAVASVASFFVSRVDTEVDRRLEAAASGGSGPGVLELRGKAAVAQAKLAYQLFVERFSGPRWEALAARGARVQRPLWASTSTKNPAYPDLAYVDTLIGPDTVNTMPDGTIADFLDHGTVARTVDTGVDEAEHASTGLPQAGIDMADVAAGARERGSRLVQRLVRRAHAVTVRQGGCAGPRLGRRSPTQRRNAMKVGMVGLGKMGANMTQRLVEHGHQVVAFDLSDKARDAVRRVRRRAGRDPGGAGLQARPTAGGLGDGPRRRGDQLDHHDAGGPLRTRRRGHRRRELQLQGDRSAGRAAGRPRASPWSTPAPRAGSGA